MISNVTRSRKPEIWHRFVERFRHVHEGVLGGRLGKVLGHPGMRGDVLERDAALRLELKALRDQVLALGGDLGVEVELCKANLLVGLEGNVAADHVVEEDAEAPDGGEVALVLVALDPLWRGVHPGTWREK